jgi:hypothetical protein
MRAKGLGSVLIIGISIKNFIARPLAFAFISPLTPQEYLDDNEQTVKVQYSSLTLTEAHVCLPTRRSAETGATISLRPPCLT